MIIHAIQAFYLQRTKKEAFEKYKHFEAKVKTQKNVKIKCLYSDRGGEFRSDTFTEHLSKQGTVQSLTISEHNGVAERVNGILLKATRAMLYALVLPRNMWGVAVMHATYLKNRTPNRANPEGIRDVDW
jgi:transposase InsO family protein